MRPLLGLVLLGAPLAGQETPRPNRVPWLAILPEPLPEGRSAVTLEATSQFLRPDRRMTADGRTQAVLDGEEWQVTGDLAGAFAGGRIQARIRLVNRSGGFLDQGFQNWHALLGTPTGGREEVPNGGMGYGLTRDGSEVAALRHPATQLLDVDLAWVRSFGDRNRGWRWGGSLQLPTGEARTFGGSGGLDVTVGAAGWRPLGPLRLHLQAEHLWVGLPESSSWRPVMGRRSLSRAWGGVTFAGQGPGVWGGLGLDVTLAWMESPLRTGLARLDRSALQQHWTFSHRALPRWRFGFSEEAGSYVAPDLTAYLVYRFGE